MATAELLPGTLGLRQVDGRGSGVLRGVRMSMRGRNLQSAFAGPAAVVVVLASSRRLSTFSTCLQSTTRLPRYFSSGAIPMWLSRLCCSPSRRWSSSGSCSTLRAWSGRPPQLSCAISAIFSSPTCPSRIQSSPCLAWRSSGTRSFLRRTPDTSRRCDSRSDCCHAGARRLGGSLVSQSSCGVGRE